MLKLKAAKSFFLGLLIYFGLVTCSTGLLLNYGTGYGDTTWSGATGPISMGFSCPVYGVAAPNVLFNPDGDTQLLNSGNGNALKMNIYWIPYTTAGTVILTRRVTATVDFNLIASVISLWSDGLFAGFSATDAFVASYNSYYNNVGTVQNIFQFITATNGYLTFVIFVYDQALTTPGSVAMWHPANNSGIDLSSYVSIPGNYIMRVDNNPMSKLLLPHGGQYGDHVYTITNGDSENTAPISVGFLFNYFGDWKALFNYWPHGDAWLYTAAQDSNHRIGPYFVADTVNYYYASIYTRMATTTSDLNTIAAAITAASATHAGFETTIAVVLSWHMKYVQGPNIFQWIIATNGTTSFFIFSYALLVNTPDINGFYTPSQFVSTANTITGTNCGMPGQYVYRVDSGTNLMLPFGPGTGDTLSTIPVGTFNFGFSVNYFGVLFDKTNINTNGQMTISNTAGALATIAPLSMTGVTKCNIFYRVVTSSSDLSILNAKVSPYTITSAVVMTWSQFVGQTQNVFQVVIGTDGTSTNLLFSYAVINSPSFSSSYQHTNGTTIWFYPTNTGSNFASPGQYKFYVYSPVTTTTTSTTTTTTTTTVTMPLAQLSSIVTIGCMGQLDLYNKSSGSRLATIYGAGGANINALAYINESVFAGGANDNNLYFWSTNFVPLYTLATGHSGTITQIVLVSAQTLATVDGDGKGKVWNLNTNQNILNYTNHTSGIGGIILLHDSNVLTWSATFINIWSWSTGVTMKIKDFSNTVQLVAQLSTQVLAVSWFKTVVTYSLTNDSTLSTYSGMTSDIKGLIVFPVSNLVIMDFNGEMRSRNWMNGTQYSSLGIPNFGTKMAKTAGGNMVKVGGYSSGGLQTIAYITISNGIYSLVWMANVSATSNSRPLSALPMDSIQLPPITQIFNRYSNPASPQTFNRSSTITLLADSLFISPFTYTMTIKWSFYLLNQTNYQVISQFTISSVNPTLTTNELTLPGNTLDYGLYLVVFTSNVSVSSLGLDYNQQDTTYLKIIPSGVIVMALANGVTQVTIGSLQGYTLEPGVYSIDLDGYYDVSTLSYKFYCQLVTNTSSGSNYVLSGSPTDLATGITTNTCFDSTSDYSVTSNKLVISSGGLIYQSGQVNQVIISTSVAGYTYYQIVIINLNQQVPELPTVSMSCLVPAFCQQLSSSVYVFSPSNIITVKGAYAGAETYINSVSYLWQVRKNQGTLTSPTWTSLSTAEQANLDGATTAELTISSNLFSSSALQYMINFTITTTSTSVSALNAQFASMMILQLNQLPYGGSCAVDLTSGLALDTYFTITCQGWADRDGIVTKYEYFASYLNNEGVVNLGNNQTGFFYTQLPKGSSSDSDRLYLFVQIFDNSGGITRYDISTSVTVPIDDNTLLSSMDDLLNGSPSSPLVQSITGASDISVASSAIIAFSSSFNQIAATSNSSSNSSSTLTTQAQAINQKLVDAISTFDLTDLSSIKAASSALSVVSATPSLVSPDTATQVVNMCAQMATNMVESGAKYGLTYIYQAASYILDASANCVQSLNSQSATSSTLQSAASQQISLINTITSITAGQLAVNGSTTVTKNNINLTIARNSMKDVYTSVQTDGVSMEFANPCAIVGKSAGDCPDEYTVQQIFSRSKSLVLNSNVDTSGSSAISVSYYKSDMSELSVSTNSSNGFYFWIPQSSAGPSLESILIENSTISSTNQLYTMKSELTRLNQSVIFELAPSDTTTIGYLFALSYDRLPVISSSQQVYDLIRILCPSNLQTENGNRVYKVFSNKQTYNSYVGFGVRELIQAEFTTYCSGSSNSTVPVLSDSSNMTAFTTPVSYLAFSTGCYYIDDSAMRYSTWGVEVLSDSNSTHTHCMATHLTEFAGSMSSMVVLPQPIDFNNVWSKADFTSNLTIYLTVIIVTCLYILMFVWCRYMDWKDNKKRMIFLLADNNPMDSYFYEMLVYTGGRRDAGTNSNVSFILSGQDGDSGIRNLRPVTLKGDKILQRGSVNSFIFSHKSPLGALSYLRVWHDNSGLGRKASWFLKFIIVHDLQNREKFYFICNNWLGVDKSDGLIDRILFLATKKEKTDLSYLMEKQTKEKLSDGHLWFSIVARPPQSSFSRTDRLTCAFVLLCLTMLMNIMYYGMGSSSSSTNQIVIGPFSLSQTQIMIGVITNLIIFPPSFLVMQIFRKSRRRKTRSAKLQENIRQALSDEMEIENQPLINKNPEANKLKKKKGRKPFTLPWWFKIIGYGLSFCIVCVCLFFIIMKGISFGDEMSRQWLTSFLISVLTSVCFTQPLQVILLSIFFVLLFRKANDDQDIEADHEDDGKAINKYYQGQTVTRNDDENDSASAFKREFDSDNPSQLAEARRQRAMENESWAVMRMILIYAVFLTVLFQVAYSKTSPLSYGYQTRLQAHVLPNITLVKTTEEMWNWLKTDFMSPIIGTTWYNGDSTDFDGFIKDYSSYVVGKLMLRQARVKTDGCSNDLSKRSVCYPDYGVGSYDNTNYGLGWTTYTQSITTPPSQQVQEAFQYSSALSIDSQPYAGLYKTYYGGGYVYQINTTASTLADIQSELTSLQENEWIDQKSRALFVEFTLYNVNVDLFAYCLILFEILPLGNIVMTYELNPMSLYTDQSAFIVAFDIIYMFFIVFFMFKEIKLMIKLKKKYLTNWWSYVNWILIAFSWVSFAMYLYRMYEKYSLMKKLKSTTSDGNSQVINFQTMQYWNSLMLMSLSFCCFIGSVKLLKVFSFSRHINMLVNVFHRVFKEMLSFMIMFLILVFAFTQMMYLMVYDRNSQFMSFATSLVTGFLMMLGKFNIDSFCQDAGQILGPITYCSFAVTVILILLNMFITLLTDSFSQIRKEYYEQRPDEDSLLLAFFKSKILPSLQNAVSFGKKKNNQSAGSNRAERYVETSQLLETRADYLIHAVKYQAKANGDELKK